MGADSFGVVADARLLRAFPPAFLLGGSLAAFFYLAVSRGMDAGYRAAGWVARRREARERTET